MRPRLWLWGRERGRGHRTEAATFSGLEAEVEINIHEGWSLVTSGSLSRVFHSKLKHYILATSSSTVFLCIIMVFTSCNPAVYCIWIVWIFTSSLAVCWYLFCWKFRGRLRAFPTGDIITNSTLYCRLLREHNQQLLIGRQHIRVLIPLCGKAVELKWFVLYSVSMWIKNLWIVCWLLYIPRSLFVVASCLYH